MKLKKGKKTMAYDTNATANSHDVALRGAYSIAIAKLYSAYSLAGYSEIMDEDAKSALDLIASITDLTDDDKSKRREIYRIMGAAYYQKFTSAPEETKEAALLQSNQYFVKGSPIFEEKSEQIIATFLLAARAMEKPYGNSYFYTLSCKEAMDVYNYAMYRIKDIDFYELVLGRAMSYMTEFDHASEDYEKALKVGQDFKAKILPVYPQDKNLYDSYMQLIEQRYKPTHSSTPSYSCSNQSAATSILKGFRKKLGF